MTAVFLFLGLPYQSTTDQWLKKHKCISHSLEASSLRWRCGKGWLLCMPLSLACTWPFSTSVFTWSSFYYSLGRNFFFFFFSFNKETSHIGLEPTLITSFNFLLKDPTSKHSYILRYWTLRLSNIWILGRHNSSYNRWSPLICVFWESQEDIVFIKTIRYSL